MGLQLDEARWKATLDGQDLDLTAVEFKLLAVLASQPGRIFSRDQLMDAMYRDERIVADRTVDSHVKKLRRKIAEIVPDHEFIHSVYGSATNTRTVGEICGQTVGPGGPDNPLRMSVRLRIDR